MTNENELLSVIERISALMGELQIPYHLTGGITSSFYGEPRFTQDIDLVLALSSQEEEISRFIEMLSDQFILDDVAIAQAIRQRKLFQALDEETMIKVDFHIGESIPGELKRSIPTEIAPGLVVPLVSREDAILSKLLWVKAGSEKSRRDVQMILLRNETIDEDYLVSMTEKLNVSELLRELRV